MSNLTATQFAQHLSDQRSGAMAPNHEPIQLIRHAIAKHIKDVAQELIYWMEELNKIESELGKPGHSRQLNRPTNG